MEKQPTLTALHFQRQLALLRKEYDCEKAEYDQHAAETGMARKKARGLCWHPVRIGRSYYNSLNQFSVEIYRTDEARREHEFEPGRQVGFFTEGIDGRIRCLKHPATVSYAEEERMVVVLPGPHALSELENARQPGVQLAFDETTYRLMFDALNEAANANGNRLAELRDILCGTAQPRFRQLFPMRFPWLNPSQDAAVNQVLASRDVQIVHGPPGTGKTTTLVEAIYETLHREPQVLVCAQSNTAVDWISEKLSERSVPVLRIGNPTRVNDKMLGFTYERQFESHPAYPELWSIRKAIREIAATLRKHGKDGKEAARNRLRHLRERAVELEVQIGRSLFDNARVVASTLAGSGNRLLDGRHFPTLFVDEAGQALEAACWIAIRKADRVVLAGDHCQLPPTVKCTEAARDGLGRTLMERVAETKPQAVALLTVQYRMNAEIMRFPSDWFYGGRLTAAPEVSQRGILDFDTPMCWTDTSEKNFRETASPSGNSRLNTEEGDFFIEEVERYTLRIGHRRILDERIDFGLISPYKAQVQYLRQKIRSSSTLRPLRHLISVNTVDGFQGQERDVIFVGLVRSNDTGEIGFLSDLRRMNVAITRARMKLVIVGAADTLTRHPFYRRLYKYISEIAEQSQDRGREQGGENAVERQAETCESPVAVADPDRP